MLHAGFSQGATAAAILLADLARSRPELLPAFCILVRGDWGIGLCNLVPLGAEQDKLVARSFHFACWRVSEQVYSMSIWHLLQAWMVVVGFRSAICMGVPVVRGACMKAGRFCGKIFVDNETLTLLTCFSMHSNAISSIEISAKCGTARLTHEGPPLTQRSLLLGAGRCVPAA